LLIVSLLQRNRWIPAEPTFDTWSERTGGSLHATAEGSLATGCRDDAELLAATGDGWRDAHLRWAVVLGVALAVLLATLRDPASGRRRAAGRRQVA
jgi:hypothetical protein